MSAPPTQIGPYRIVRSIGQGGMGAVYEAVQEPIERRVALKVLLPQHAQNGETLSRFFNEARSVNRIEHPSIVQISDYGQAPDGTAFLVMEYLGGDTLGGRLSRYTAAGQCMPWVEAAQIAAQIADALAAAHDKSIVHRDLKPGNVMLVRDSAVPGGERAKILDFGIAKLAQEQERGTATHALLGTPQYMSPEQCRGAGGVDDKTDVYALGVMLYEMVAGRPPFVGENTVEYIGQHVFEEPPSLYKFAPQAHPPLAKLIHRLLLKDKAVRPTMREVGRELGQLIAGRADAEPATGRALQLGSEPTRGAVPPTTLGESLGQRMPPHPRRRLKTVGVVAAVTVAVGVVLGVVVRPFGGHKAATTPPSPTLALAAPPAAAAPIPAAAAPPPASQPAAATEPTPAQTPAKRKRVAKANVKRVPKPGPAITPHIGSDKLSKSIGPAVTHPVKHED